VLLAPGRRQRLGLQTHLIGLAPRLREPLLAPSGAGGLFSGRLVLGTPPLRLLSARQHGLGGKPLCPQPALVLEALERCPGRSVHPPSCAALRRRS